MHRTKLPLTLALLAAALATAPALRAADDEPNFPTIEELEKLPTGLKVVHEPNPTLATPTAKGDLRGKYKWYFKTTVTATVDDITIEQFGGFNLVGDKWVQGTTITGKPYGAKEFAEWYECKDAKLAKGKSASDPTNWSAGNELVKAKSRLYFIGVDSKGRRVKGEAIIELKPEIDPKKPKDPE